MSQDGFGKALLVPDEVQAIGALSPDGLEFSILLTGLRVRLAADAGSASRGFGFELPAQPPVATTGLVAHLRGGITLGADTRALLLVTLAGRTRLAEVTADGKGGFFVEQDGDWPAGGRLLGHVMLLLARDGSTRAGAPALLDLDSIELAARST